MERKSSPDELILAEQREYMRQWRAKNSEKVRANNRRYWLRRIEKRAEGEEKQ